MGEGENFVFQFEFNKAGVLKTMNQHAALNPQRFNRPAARFTCRQMPCHFASLAVRQLSVGINGTGEFTQTGHFISPCSLFPASAAVVVSREKSESQRGSAPAPA